MQVSRKVKQLRLGGIVYTPPADEQAYRRGWDIVLGVDEQERAAEPRNQTISNPDAGETPDDDSGALSPGLDGRAS